MEKLRRSLPSMNGLFTFEAAARCGNFSRAAEELNVTPAAVSRMVARLEEHLETTLFVRQPGGVRLTESGRLLFDAIARGFSGIENALREIEDRRIGIQTVSLSVSTGFTTHWMMPRMADFKKEFPAVDLRFQLVMGALAGPVNDVDLGMRFVNGSDERHEAVFIMPEILIPICSPSYIESHGSEATHVKRMPDTTINLSDAQPNWSGLFSPLNKGDAVNSMIFSDYAIVVQAALLGQGVALGWLNVIAHWLRTRALVPAREQLMITGRQCHLVRLRDKPARPIVAQVREWMIGELNADIVAVDALYPTLGLKSAGLSKSAG
ncbi:MULTISPECIES: LysR family transcriptional regulator [unclassified Mesorhizobium]|uniref:LysR family transcriptional regulator n=1 Tax=unclassified Mesorhizobium TaxID=325217 RepID=UPI000FCCDCB4|nr:MULTISPECIES: LysR family transcriptional regulator [unclassified Mesorhizobium]RUV51896.1 LysR family transcriptional regulator [Mesorhizobium sp. M7A.F.Ca.MR.228.00.0.0]RWN97859.1 MAG: LysR family transcriptional regulator [Mesorhizobium sp.]RUU81223.1 LysR family transcriptional regulator [Mesorhizobium sp. M7A.F.Ca.MR.362.00.0.0]RUU92600.1 LysR family transcriptional regulator [Mesorhizobium sp. M7A.F.Ca.MR.176.00.0.0]RUV21008.1 LysR family transcriptional regulator [Mesorhizobium sp. M